MFSFAQNVTIPDTNLKSALLAISELNTTNDGEISEAEAVSYSGILDLDDLGITDPTGLEFFPNITELRLRNNSVGSIDLSNNTALTVLDLRNNGLSSIDVSNLTQLTYLELEVNDLTTLDVTNNTLLTDILIQANDITSLDLSQNTELQSARLHANPLASVDLTTNTKITSLILNQTNLSSIDVSNQPNLSYLSLRETQITSIDLSNNPNLTSLNVQSNTVMTELDLSINRNLVILSLSNSTALSSVNLRNGNNANMTSVNFSGTSSLTCISVDDVSYSEESWTFVHENNEFVTYCDPNDPVYIPDENFKAALVGNNSINTNEDDEISFGEAGVVESIIADNQGIIDLTGLEAFSNLTTLWLTSNSIVTADLTSNTLLETAVLNSNFGLTSVDVGGLTELLNFQVKGGDLTELDVSTNTKLQGFEFFQNDIAEIDISNNPDLRHVNFSFNDLTELDVSNNLELRTLNFWSNQVSTPLDLSQHPHITTVQFSNNQISEVNLANGFNENITLINGSSNPATCVKVDDKAYSEAEWAHKFNEGVNFSDTYCDPNDPVNIPDQILKTSLLTHSPAINTNADDEISYAEAEAFTHNLLLSNLAIADATGIEAFTNMAKLFMQNTNITSLDISSGQVLIEAYLNGNSQLASMTIGELPLLETLVIRQNQLTTIDVTGLPALSVLWIDSNPDLTTIDVSQNTLLTNLDAYGCDLSTIDVSNNLELDYLNVGANNLIELDVSKNLDLTVLYAQDNQIEALDMRPHTKLVRFRAENNALTKVNLKNGNNHEITDTFFNVTGNTELTCMVVDDANYAESTWTKIVEGLMFSDTYCNPTDPVFIPDEIFKAALVGDNSINTNEDAEISYEEAEAFTGTIVVNSSTQGVVSDLTGVEAFINLEVIQLINHDIAEFDASNHPNLRNLILPNNELTEIDITANPALTFVNLQSNQISEIDVSNNTNLRTLKMSNNQLSEVDVSARTLLTELTLGSNNLSSIDISNNPSLQIFDAFDNTISTLDLSQNTALRYLNVSNTDLTSLDVSQQPDLLELRAMSSELVSVNLQNGANTELNIINLINNFNLTCVQVDDVDYAETNWSESVDEGARFSEDCDRVYIPDETFENYLLAQGSINTTDDGRITFEEAEAFTGTISVQNMGIDDLTGIEAFVNLTGLVAWLNNVTSVDLSNNTKLQTLELNSNPLESLDITQLPLLRTLILNDAPVGDLDLSNNTALEDIRLVNIGMTSITVDHLTNLRTLMIKENPAITSVDLTQNQNLRDFRFGSTGITTIDVSQNQQLATIEMLASDVSVLGLANHPSLTILDVRSSDLTLLDISNCPSLFTLRVANTAIQEIDASSNSSLTVLDASNMASLTALNVKNGNNSNVTTFNLSNSPNVSCVTVDDVAYSEANWTQIESGVIFSTDCSNDATDITAYDQVGSVSDASIDDESHTVTLEMLFGSDVTRLSPSIAISDGASISPEGPQDFTSPVTYTITAEDRQTTQDWLVTVSLAENLAPAVEIEIEDQSETIGFSSVEIGTNGVFVDPEGQDLTITATSSDETVVTVSVGESDQIIVTQQGIGESTITVTADDGFGGTISDTFVFAVDQLTLGTKDLDGIKVYPNPTRNIISLDGVNQSFTARVLDLNGREVVGKSNEKEINLSSLEAGMYLLHVELADGSSKVIRISKTN